MLFCISKGRVSLLHKSISRLNGRAAFVEDDIDHQCEFLCKCDNMFVWFFMTSEMLE